MSEEKKEVLSRIGKKVIDIPDNVKVSVQDKQVSVDGKLGKLESNTQGQVAVHIEDNKRVVVTQENIQGKKALHGLWRSLINNMVIGVSQGFEKNLKLVGVGYRAQVSEHTLTLNVGYSNPVEYPIPEGIDIKVDNQTVVSIKGIDKSLVGVTAAKIRSVRPPEPYNEKGIRYADEVIQKKEGKSGGK